MAKNSNKKRRAATERAVQVEREKGTSKKNLYKKSDSKIGADGVAVKSTKKKIIIISIIAALVLAAVVVCLHLVVFNDKDHEAEGISYVYNAELGGYEVYASGKDITTAYIPEEIDGTPVVSIARFGFADCKALSSISIPDSIKRIGTGAFNNCTALTYTQYNNAKYLGNEENPHLVLITVRADVEDFTVFQTERTTKIIYDSAFAELPYMQLVIVTDNVKQIGASAFANSPKLAEISVYPGVEQIGDFAFQGCTALTTVTFSGSDPKIGAYAFAGCKSLLNVTLPYAMTQIPDGMFNSTGIMDIKLPSTVQRIGKNAFEGCSSLSMSSFPASLVSIDSYAFNGCAGITLKGGENDKNLDNTALKHIGAYAFQNCEKIEFVRLPATFESFGIGAFKGCKNMTTFHVDQNAPVKKLSNSLLQGCERLSMVSVGAIEHIGSLTFSGCTALDRIPAKDSLKSIGSDAFAKCLGLTSIEIPASVESIGDNAFWACNNLHTVILNEGLVSIGAGAFDTTDPVGSDPVTSSLTIKNIPSTLKYLGYVFEDAALEGSSSYDVGFKALAGVGAYTQYEGGSYIGTTTNPYMILVEFASDSDVTNAIIHPDTKIIASGAFYKNAKITSVTLPEGLQIINDYAFAGCTALAEIIIPDSVTTVMNGAFYDCRALTNAVLSASLTALQDYVFAGCSSLKTFTIPAGITSVGTSALHYCLALESINFENINSIISGAASILQVYDPFNPPTYESYQFTDDGGVLYIGNTENPYLILYKAADKTIASYNINSGTKFVHAEAFSGCTALASVLIPESVIEIGDMAFFGCTALTSVNIPTGVKKISNSLFYNCTALASVTFGSIQEVGISAFSGCKSLTSLTFTDALKSIGDGAFSACTSLQDFYIPASVEKVGDMIFTGCTALYEVRVGVAYEHEGYTPTWSSSQFWNGKEYVNLYIHVKHEA